MPRSFLPFVLTPIIGLLFAISCLDIVPLWKGSRTMENYLLPGDSAACSFPIHLDSLAPIMYIKIELEVTYDTYTGRNELPIKLTMADSTGAFSLTPTSVIIPIRKEGKWLGYPYKSNREYIVVHTAIPRQKVYPGSYTLNLSADNRDLSFLPGIIAIGVRLYKM